MLTALKRYLRVLSGNGFTRVAVRKAGPLLLLTLMLSFSASAYTIVLKSGRRIEIPSSFIVTERTLTYEAAPGLNVTLLVQTIDIPATERANNEPAGSLLRRASNESERLTSNASSGPKARRELTQADIEKGRAERQKSEQAYERRRVELGLPSLEEARRRSEEEIKRLGEQSELSRTQTAQAESYWRGRASELRVEMASVDAQINYLRSQLAAMPDPSSIGAYTFIGGSQPFIPFRHPRTVFPAVTGNPGFMRGPNQVVAPGNAGFLAFGGSGAQAAVQLRAGISRGNFGGRVRTGPGIITGVGPLFGIPNYDYATERANLIKRLHELETERAGLQARWRLLEEELRRAGGQPGWVRP